MSLKAIAQSYGDPVKRVEYAKNEVTATLLLKRLPFIELDNLRAGFLGADGKFDASKSAGHRARLIAKAVREVTDESPDGRELTEYEIGQWPDEMVQDIAKLVDKHNATDSDAQKTASKNSDSAPTAGG